MMHLLCSLESLQDFPQLEYTFHQHTLLVVFDWGVWHCLPSPIFLFYRHNTNFSYNPSIPKLLLPKVGIDPKNLSPAPLAWPVCTGCHHQSWKKIIYLCLLVCQAESDMLLLHIFWCLDNDILWFHGGHPCDSPKPDEHAPVASSYMFVHAWAFYYIFLAHEILLKAECLFEFYEIRRDRVIGCVLKKL